MAVPGSFDMEAFQNMMRNRMDELIIKQKEKFKEVLKESKNDLKQDKIREFRQELRQAIRDRTTLLADKIVDTNKCINALENTIEITPYEQKMCIRDRNNT